MMVGRGEGVGLNGRCWWMIFGLRVYMLFGVWVCRRFRCDGMCNVSIALCDLLLLRGETSIRILRKSFFILYNKLVSNRWGESRAFTLDRWLEGWPFHNANPNIPIIIRIRDSVQTYWGLGLRSNGVECFIYLYLCFVDLSTNRKQHTLY